MAVNFGRLGTIKLNGGARLVCTPESQITSSGGGGGGGDVTPNPTPNWEEDGTYAGFTLTEQVTGINQAITLKLSWVDVSLNALYAYIGTTNPPTNYISNITNNSTLSVNPNDYIWFGKENYSPSTFIATITVTNVSDNNTILDTFTIGNFD